MKNRISENRKMFVAGTLGLSALLCGALAATAVQAEPMSGRGTWETTLQGRDLDGDASNGVEAFYDTTRNITWLRAASASIIYDWANAKTWAEGDRYGLSGWRLPTMVDTETVGFHFGETDSGYNVDTVTSELAYLYYVTLGNLAYCPPVPDCAASGPQVGWDLLNTGGFENLIRDRYWSGLELSFDYAWYFDNYDGNQGVRGKGQGAYALAVRAGDVTAPIPEPETYAMMLAGLGLLGSMTRRRKQKLSA